METNVSRRLISGINSNFYAQLVTIISQLVSVPILLYSWGANLYGEWIILSAIPVLLGMSDLGITLTAGNYMLQKLSRNEDDEVLEIFQTLGVLVLCVCAIGLFIITGVIFLTDIASYFNLAGISIQDSQWILWFFSAEIFFRLINGVTYAGFRANQDYAYYVKLESMVRLTQFFAVSFIALIGEQPITAALFFLLPRLLFIPYASRILSRRQSLLHFGLKHINYNSLLPLAKPSIANLSIPLSAAINMQGVILLIGSILGPASVVTFTTLRTLTNSLTHFTIIISHSSEPELATAYGSNNRKLMCKLFYSMFSASLWGVIIFSVLLLIFGSELFSAWTQEKVYFDKELFYLLVLSTIAYVFWYAPLILLRASNRHMRCSYYFFIVSILAIFIAAGLLSYTNSLVSIGLVILLTNIILAPYAIMSVKLIIGIKVFDMLRNTLDPRDLIYYIFRKIRALR